MRQIWIIKTELYKLINSKNILVLFGINFINDTICLTLYNKIVDIDYTMAHGYLFNRFYCVDLNILQYSMYISVLAFISFLVINEITRDNQKFGVFYLIRLTRKEYILSKIFSIFIFSIIIGVVIFLQSFLTHRCLGVLIPATRYFTNFVIYIILTLAGNFLGITIYSLSKNSNIAFLVTILLYSFQSVLLFKKGNAIPKMFVIDLCFYWPIAAILICIGTLIIKLEFNDFITTKIKE